MSLKTFHIVFISLSAILSLGLLLWGVTNDRLLAVVGLLGLVLLVLYFRWFRQKMKGLTCAVCLGDPTSLLTQGAKSGVLFLIVVIAAVLAMILAVALTWAKREKNLNGLGT